MNKEKLLDALRDCAVVRVVVNYSGSGDSGQIDDVQFFDAKGAHAEKADEARIEVIENVSEPADDEENHWREFQRARMVLLRDALEEFAYDALETHCGGWEINEGSQGHVEFLVKEGTVFLHHQENVMSTEDSSYEL